MSIKETMLEGIDEPVPSPEGFNLFKKNKIRIIMIFEDMSFKEIFKKYPSSYIFTIKKKSYFLVPKCLIRGKYPTIIYFYNNPSPLFLEFKQSTLKAIDTYSDEQLNKLADSEKVTLNNIFLDAETINLAFTTRVMQGLYSNNPITIKAILLILGVVFVIILIILQVTGTVDVWGAISGQGAK